MEWKDVISVISKAAPVLGSLFGPAGTAVGAVAGTGLNLVARALGVEPTEDAVKQAIATDPEAALKLAQYEMLHKIELQKLEIQVMQMEYADTADARRMSSDKMKSTGKPDLNLYILAWTIIIGFFALIGFLLKVPIPVDQSGVIFMLFGALSTGFGQVLQFFFGSSKSSADKNEQIGQLRKQLGK